MIITWLGTGSTNPATICGGDNPAAANPCGPDALDIQVQPGLIPRNYVDGGGPKHDATGNDAVSVSFRVSILCANAPAAAALAASLITAATTPRTGTLAFLPAAGQAATLTVLDTGLKLCRPAQNGARITVNYAFEGHL